MRSLPIDRPLGLARFHLEGKIVKKINQFTFCLCCAALTWRKLHLATQSHKKVWQQCGQVQLVADSGWIEVAETRALTGQCCSRQSPVLSKAAGMQMRVFPALPSFLPSFLILPTWLAKLYRTSWLSIFLAGGFNFELNWARCVCKYPCVCMCVSLPAQLEPFLAGWWWRPIAKNNYLNKRELFSWKRRRSQAPRNRAC